MLLSIKVNASCKQQEAMNSTCYQQHTIWYSFMFIRTAPHSISYRTNSLGFHNSLAAKRQPNGSKRILQLHTP